MTTSPTSFIRRFYEARKLGDPEMLRPLIAADVIWEEPEVADKMGRLVGVDAVLDMIGQALLVTDRTFQLSVTEAVETATHCAPIISWSAERDGKSIRGRELALFRVADQQIQSAAFYPENVADVRAFWGEP